METKKLPASLHQIVRRYVRAFSPEKIYLYGSHAKGTQHAGSDLDVLIIVNHTGDLTRLLARARQLSAGCFPVVDISFASADDVVTATADKNAFLISVTDYGIRLYDKSH